MTTIDGWVEHRPQGRPRYFEKRLSPHKFRRHYPEGSVERFSPTVGTVRISTMPTISTTGTSNRPTGMPRPRRAAPVRSIDGEACVEVRLLPSVIT
jgi:hypothetical protein